MPTHILRLDPHNIDPESLEIAAGLLRRGGLVAFPTETVYGLGANAFDEAAVLKIFEAKGRPASNPIIVHVSDAEQVADVAVALSPLARELMSEFWPGPLTLVLRRGPRVAPGVSGGRDTVAVRMPSHPIARALIRRAGVPVAAPSANRFTRPSATSAAHVLEDLGDRIDLILDGGAATIGVESTVLDATQTPPLLLRPGGVSLESLRRLVPGLRLAPQYLQLVEGSQAPASPGMLTKHYSPAARLLLFRGPDFARVTAAMLERARLEGARRVGVLTFEEDDALFAEAGCPTYCLGGVNSLDSVASRLFEGLRSLDRAQTQLILAREAPGVGLGLALNDRLYRAAEGQLVEVP